MLTCGGVCMLIGKDDISEKLSKIKLYIKWKRTGPRFTKIP